ncbi:hypothetical protein [Candidatus Harpocratesius sp.]
MKTNTETMENSKLVTRYERKDRVLICFAAFSSGIVLILLAVLGPLGLEVIKFKTSQSGIWQTQGQDLANVILIAPICIAAGYTQIKNHSISKYLLTFASLTLIYTGISYGIGQEWNHPNLTGNYNIQEYFWMFLILIIDGLIMMIFGLMQFTEDDAPDFNSKGLKRYGFAVMGVLSLFAMMWLKEILEVVNYGDTATGSYSATPVVFWVIRYLDLGLSIPIGYIAMYLLMTRPKRAFPLMILFFGFFIGMITAVNAMAWIMFLRNDPEFQTFGLFLFGTLGFLSYGGFYYLIRKKIPFFRRS